MPKCLPELVSTFPPCPDLHATTATDAGLVPGLHQLQLQLSRTPQRYTMGRRWDSDVVVLLHGRA